VIELKPVEWKVKDNVGVISVSSFSANVGTQVAAAWRDIRAKTGNRPAGLILDLRGNPGGLLDEAVSLSDLFLEKGRSCRSVAAMPATTRCTTPRRAISPRACR
jgi:carboxyl-terminal processing protease